MNRWTLHMLTQKWGSRTSTLRFRSSSLRHRNVDRADTESPIGSCVWSNSPMVQQGSKHLRRIRQ